MTNKKQESKKPQETTEWKTVVSKKDRKSQNKRKLDLSSGSWPHLKKDASSVLPSAKVSNTTIPSALSRLPFPSSRTSSDKEFDAEVEEAKLVSSRLSEIERKQKECYKELERLDMERAKAMSLAEQKRDSAAKVRSIGLMDFAVLSSPPSSRSLSEVKPQKDAPPPCFFNYETHSKALQTFGEA